MCAQGQEWDLSVVLLVPRLLSPRWGMYSVSSGKRCDRDSVKIMGYVTKHNFLSRKKTQNATTTTYVCECVDSCLI